MSDMNFGHQIEVKNQGETFVKTIQVIGFRDHEDFPQTISVGYNNIRLNSEQMRTFNNHLLSIEKAAIVDVINYWLNITAITSGCRIPCRQWEIA